MFQSLEQLPTITSRYNREDGASAKTRDSQLEISEIESKLSGAEIEKMAKCVLMSHAQGAEKQLKEKVKVEGKRRYSSCSQQWLVNNIIII